MSHSPVLSRRRFLRRTAGAAAGALCLPTIAPEGALGTPTRAAASERIGVGWIGTGNRGSAVAGQFLGQKDVQLTSVCDVKTAVRERARERVDKHYGGKGCAATGDFRELLDRKDVEVVLIASTDHWHVLHALHAARAGKDMYLEKPMGLDMGECIALREAIHRYGRVFQFGTQQRSDRKFRLACELARNEKIGELKTIRVWSPGSASGGPTESAPVPDGLDYDFWLGPARYHPYTKDRCSNRWWWYISDYALGFIAGWGIHPMDIAVWGGENRLTGVIEVEGKGEFPAQGLCDTATNWHVHLRYPTGVTVEFTGDPRPKAWTERYPGTQSHGTAFEGTEGWVHVNRAVVNSSPEGLVGTKLGPDDLRLHRSDHHVRDLLDASRSRGPTVAGIDAAVRSETLIQVSEIAIRLGRKLRWDQKAERFLDDDGANRMLTATMRSPWHL